MPTFKELLEECRDEFMPMLIGAIEGGHDLEWPGTYMMSEDFHVMTRTNFVVLPTKMVVQRLIEAANEDHKKALQTEKAAAYVEKLSKWLDNTNKEQKAEADKEIEERREFVAMLISAADGDRDPEWLGGYILSGDFDAAIRAGFALLPPAIVLKSLSEIADDDQKKSLSTEKAAAYVARISKWLDDFNKVQKAAAAAELQEQQAAQQAPGADPAPMPQETVPAK